MTVEIESSDENYEAFSGEYYLSTKDTVNWNYYPVENNKKFKIYR